MSPLRVSSPSKLPRVLRDRVDAAPVGKPRRETTRENCPGHCACGQAFATYGVAFERHADAAGHHRWIIDLPGETT